MRPYILVETNWKDTTGSEIKVAILPWATTEAYN